MPDWQPIETAPKDGTRILAVWGKFPMRIMEWKEVDGPFGPFANWVPESGPIVLTEQPKCWQPLPEPPAA
jgi:hypothetical protein